MACKKTIIIGFDHHACKEIVCRCGEVSVYGRVEFCNECMEEYKRKYPQGWRNVPGDTCRHGNYVGDAYGADYICGPCEDGE